MNPALQVPMADVIWVDPEFRSRVRLRSFFSDPELNRGKVSSYFLTSTHGSVLRQITDRTRRGFHLASGRPGSGKSHFALMLSNLLRRPYDFDSMLPGRNDRPFLVLLPGSPDPDSLLPEEQQLDGALTDSLHEALAREGTSLPAAVRVPFSRALEVFARELLHQGTWQGVALVQDDFHRWVPQLCNGAGAVLERAHQAARLLHLPFLYVAVGSATHQLTAHDMAAVLPASATHHSLSITDLEHLVPQRILRTSVSSDVAGHPHSSRLAEQISSLKLYPEMSADGLRDFIGDTFPLHPLSTYCLSRVAERVSTEQQNLHAFFAYTRPNGLRDFISRNTCVEEKGRLAFYQLEDLLLTFETACSRSPHITPHWQALVRSRHLGSQVPGALAILATIFFFHLANSPLLRPKRSLLLQTVASHDEEVDLQKSLDSLVKTGCLRHDPATGEYHLPVDRGPLKVADIVGSPTPETEPPIDAVPFLERLFPPLPIEVPGFRRGVRTAYVHADDLTDLASLRRRLRMTGRRADELFLLYLVDGDVTSARTAVLNPTFDFPQAVVSLARHGRAFADGLEELHRLERMSALVGDEETPVGEELKALMQQVRGRLTSQMAEFMQPENQTLTYQGQSTDGLSEVDRSHYLADLLHKLTSRLNPVPEASFWSGRGAEDSADRSLLMELLLGPGGPIAPATDAQTLLCAALVSSGYLEVDLEGLYRLQVPPEQSVFHGAYRRLEERLGTDSGAWRHTCMDETVQELTATYPLEAVELLLALFLARYRGGLRLYRGARHMAETLDLTAEPLRPGAVRALVRQPADWMVVWNPSSPERDHVLEAMAARLDPAYALTSYHMCEDARQVLTAWGGRQPEEAAGLDGDAEVLMRLAREAMDAMDPVFFWERVVTGRFGYQPDRFNWRFDGETLLARVDSARRSIESVGSQVPRLLESAVRGALKLPHPLAADALASWFASLPRGRCEPAGDAGLLVKHLGGPWDGVGIRRLAAEMYDEPPEAWLQARFLEFQERLARAALELRLQFIFEGLYSTVQASTMDAKQVENFLGVVLLHSELKGSAVDDLLGEVLERLTLGEP